MLYCDDRAQDIRRFVDDHSDEFHIDVVDRLADVPRKLSHMKRLPDVVVLDLYHPRDVPDFEERRQEAEARLDELTTCIKVAKEAVDRAWAPKAIDMLEEIRAKYSHRQLPVMIYTRRGLLLLDTDELLRMEGKHAEWLLKDHDRDVRASRMRRFSHRLRSSSRLQRDIKLTIAGTFAGGAVGVATTLLLG